MSDNQWDLCIIGAGPAGLEAAVSASACGLEVLVFDEHAVPGGHIYHGLEGPFAGTHLDPDVRAQGLDLLRRFRQSGAAFLPGHTVWAASPREIIASHNGVSRSIRTRALIVANGAMERPAPFPGWTLPGVMAAGGADLLWRSAGVTPQAPVVLMGNGPLLLLTAARLLESGVDVPALIDTGLLANRVRALPRMPAALLDLPYLRKGLGMVATIVRRRLPLVRSAQVRAEGKDRVEQVVCATDKGERRFAASTLLVHEDFLPRTHFSRLLRCPHRWHPTRRYWHPDCSDSGACAGLPGLFFTGDGQDVQGADAAQLKGRLCGIEAARFLGAIRDKEAEARSRAPRGELGRLLLVRSYVNALFRPNPVLYRLPDETMLCRCEQITAGAVREAVREGCLDINDIKTRTRAGMGSCQGRMCGQAVAEVAAQALCSSPERLGALNIRPPLRPVSMREFCEFEQ